MRCNSQHKITHSKHAQTVGRWPNGLGHHAKDQSARGYARTHGRDIRRKLNGTGTVERAAATARTMPENCSPGIPPPGSKPPRPPTSFPKKMRHTHPEHERNGSQLIDTQRPFTTLDIRNLTLWHPNSASKVGLAETLSNTPSIDTPANGDKESRSIIQRSGSELRTQHQRAR